MFTVRCVFVLHDGGHESHQADADAHEGADFSEQLILSKVYRTVERRCRLTQGSWYVPLPMPAAFCMLFFQAVTADPPICGFPHLLSLSNGLWPVVWIRRHGIYYVTVPETVDSESKLLHELPFVSYSIALLLEICHLASPFSPKFTTAQTAELQYLLSVALPFGCPSGSLNKEVLQGVLQRGFSLTQAVRVPNQKIPEWKPQTSIKGSPRVELVISEQIRAVQYDNPQVADTWQLGGTLCCRAELEGLAELTIPLGTVKEELEEPRKDIVFMTVHPCVNLAGDPLQQPGRKLSCIPPLQQIALASYGCRSPSLLPIRGFYQMKVNSPSEVRVLLQLKLDHNVMNNFSYCEVQLPFFNRGYICNHQATPTIGRVSVARDFKSLLWNIGKKFVGNNLEVDLAATVMFDSECPQQELSLLPTDRASSYSVTDAYESADWVSSDYDPYCSEETCYALLRFKILGWTASGTAVDPRKVKVFPSPRSRVSVTVERCTTAQQYVIWNSLCVGKRAIEPPVLAVEGTSV